MSNIFKTIRDYIQWQIQMKKCEHHWTIIYIESGMTKMNLCKICSKMQPYQKDKSNE